MLSQHSLVLGRRARTVLVVLALLGFLLWRQPAGSLTKPRGPESWITSLDISLADSPAVSGKLSTMVLEGDYCRSHGLKPHKPAKPGTKRKIYDLFMINMELEWLEIRLNTTYNAVDYFVIVEAPRSFTGLDKELTIKKNWDRFKAYHKKMIYHQLEYPKTFNPKRPWDYEDLQRDAMFKQVFPKLQGEQAPEMGDVILVADADEIIRPATLMVLRNCAFPRRLTLRSQFYYYSFQFRHRGEQWPHPQATYYEGLWGTVSPVNLRNGDGGLQPWIAFDKADMWNAGWHCSSCFSTMETFLTKMASTSHTYQNQEYYRDKDRIAEKVRTGKDMWDREGEEYDRIEDNRDVPKYLLEHTERFRHLLNRDGETAGFTDYP